LVEVADQALRRAGLNTTFRATALVALDAPDLQEQVQEVQQRLHDLRIDQGPQPSEEVVRAGVALRCYLFLASLVRYLDQTP
jgi:hypothetical protein